MNATPRPWRLVQYAHDEYPEHHPSHARLVGDNNICIGILFGEIEEVREARDLIVRAVNSFDELMADREYMKKYRDAYCRQTQVIDAMREALEGVVRELRPVGNVKEIYHQLVAYEAAKAALALANGHS